MLAFTFDGQSTLYSSKSMYEESDFSFEQPQNPVN